MQTYFFRGKDTNSSWVYGDLQSYTHIDTGVVQYFISHATSNNTCIGDVIHPVVPDTISMYTGKDDIDKVKIFGGDIVEGDFPYASRGEIVWDERRCGFFIRPISFLGRAGTDKYYGMGSRKLKVIGNRWDNEDLLKYKPE